MTVTVTGTRTGTGGFSSFLAVLPSFLPFLLALIPLYCDPICFGISTKCGRSLSVIPNFVDQLVAPPPSIMLCCLDWFCSSPPLPPYIKRNAEPKRHDALLEVFREQTTTKIADVYVMYMFEADFEVVRVEDFEVGRVV